MIYEAGEALRFDELSIRAGIRGIRRVMRKLGMLPPGRGRKAPQAVVARTTSWVRAPASGIVSHAAALGSRVRQNDQLALISDPLGDHEDPVRAPFDGIVIGCSRLPLAHEGDALFNIAAFHSVGKAVDAVEEFATIHDPALHRKVEGNLLET
jgi:predicted deacylase